MNAGATYKYLKDEEAQYKNALRRISQQFGNAHDEAYTQSKLTDVQKEIKIMEREFPEVLI